MNVRALNRWCVWMSLVALALPAHAQSDAAVELERKRLEEVVREMSKDARAETAFASAREVMQEGPVKVKLADQAVLQLTRGHVFVPAAEAAALMRVWGSRPGPDLLGMVMPSEDTGGNWFVVIHYTHAGFVRDTDAKQWNADAMLATLRQGGGTPELQVLGWLEAPKYDAAAHQLVWSLAARDARGKTDAARSVNYNAFTLGREGFISMNMVTNAGEIERYKPAMRTLLSGLAFRDGKRYEDFEPSADKVASHGLTALVAPHPAATHPSAGPSANPAASAVASPQPPWRSGIVWLLGVGAALLLLAMGRFWLGLRKAGAGEGVRSEHDDGSPLGALREAVEERRADIAEAAVDSSPGQPDESGLPARLRRIS